MKRIVLIDNDKLTRVFLNKKFKEQSLYSLAGYFLGAEQALNSNVSADFVILEISETDGIDSIADLSKIFNKAPIIIHSVTHDFASIMRAFKSGAMAYIEKSADDSNLFKALEIAERGDYYLTPMITRNLIIGLQNQSDDFITIPINPRYQINLEKSCA
jgi:DNA-binding NarL/FixJ family response regulator